MSHAENYSPPTASIVVDGNSGTTLQASNPDTPRHPASLTKIMTLYLLFERLEAGKLKLDSPLKVSEHASEQAPTKLGLRPGETIAVEDAIKAIVTKSANDAAVAVAENLGGNEDHFAKLMTQEARALGMTRTTYTNASGLPDDDQVTTARDQALLGRLIQKRFPRHYKYFSTESFVYHGATMLNHNHLLGVIEGVDGIKTGFTRASGFNLVTSVHHDGRYIVAVVMGGRSSLERDAHMRELIRAQIKGIALKHAAPAIAKSNPRDEPRPALANASVASQGNPINPIWPPSVTTITFPTTPVQSASLAPMPALVPVAATTPQPSAQVAARWLPPAAPADAPMSAPATTVIEKSTLPLPRGDGPSIRNQPRLVKTITIQTRPAAQSASAAPMPELVPVAATTPQPSAQVTARWLPPAPPTDQAHTVIASDEPKPITKTPTALAFSESAELEPEKIEATKLAAARVELAPSSTHERIKRMRDSGVLRGTHAEVDPKALGIGLEALFMIELSKHQRGTVDQFMDDIAGVPEVRVAFLMTGRYDVVVHVVVRDTQHLKDLALDQFTSRPGVTRIETSIIYEARRRYQLPVFQMED